MSHSLHDKALAAIGQERVRVIKATTTGIALDVESSRPCPDTLRRDHYRTLLYKRDGQLERQCSCPALKRCYHLAAAELIWRPGFESEESAR